MFTEFVDGKDVTLHSPGKLDLIIRGESVGKFFSGFFCGSVKSKINMARRGRVIAVIFFMGFPFGLKHKLLHPKGILVLAKKIINQIHLCRTVRHHLSFGCCRLSVCWLYLAV